MAQNVTGDFESFQESAVSAGLGANGKTAYSRVVVLGAGTSIEANVSIGAITIEAIAPGVSVGVNVLTALPAGTNLIGGVSVRGTPDVNIASVAVGVSIITNNTPVASATTSVVAVSSGLVAVNALGANTARVGFSIFNGASSILYVRPGAVSASLSDYSFQVAPGQTWEPQAGFRFTGAYSVFFATVATGNGRFTEYTP